MVERQTTAQPSPPPRLLLLLLPSAFSCRHVEWAQFVVSTEEESVVRGTGRTRKLRTHAAGQRAGPGGNATQTPAASLCTPHSHITFDSVTLACQYHPLNLGGGYGRSPARRTAAGSRAAAVPRRPMTTAAVAAGHRAGWRLPAPGAPRRHGYSSCRRRLSGGSSQRNCSGSSHRHAGSAAAASSPRR